MKIILLRFEKEAIHLLECDIDAGNLVVGKKEKISLGAANNDGEKYNKILDELSHIPSVFTPDLFAYQPAPPNLRGKIDEIRHANEAMLNLFCFQNSLELLKLTKPSVRNKLSVSNDEFKKLLGSETNEVIQGFSIAKSDKLIGGLVFLSLLKKTF